MVGIIDLKTGKIIGCKKGSFAWWHEKGHLVYNKSEKGIKNTYAFELSLFLTLIALVAAQFSLILKWIPLGTISIALFLFLYEEIWCDGYAREKRGLRKK